MTASRDGALVGSGATLLREPIFEAKKLLSDYEFVSLAMRNCRIPQEVETYYELQKTMAYLSDSTFTILPPPYNHAIPWSVVRMAKDTVLISTTRGTISLLLLPDNAPATCASFVKLVQDKFYDGKIVHRVVPNFVLQSGCPRGDGWGGLDYTLRSELSPLHYDGAGWVGMASAGKDTEGTQWFITHNATPHLDGRYTIFARVIAGMDVVQEIEIGDKIEAITLK